MKTVASSSWEGQPREGFTAYMARVLNVPVGVDDVSDQEVAIVVKRQHVLSALIGLQRNKQTVGVRHVVSNN